MRSTVASQASLAKHFGQICLSAFAAWRQIGRCYLQSLLISVANVCVVTICVFHHFSSYQVPSTVATRMIARAYTAAKRKQTLYVYVCLFLFHL